MNQMVAPMVMQSSVTKRRKTWQAIDPKKGPFVGGPENAKSGFLHPKSRARRLFDFPIEGPGDGEKLVPLPTRGSSVSGDGGDESCCDL